MKRLHVQNTPRCDDDRLLHWLDLRCRGVGPTAIARQYGSAKSTVIKALNAVIADDITFSGEADVRRGYWT